MDHGMQQQTYRIDEDMPLFAFDLLASVIPIGIDAGPPFFSALYALAVDHTGGRPAIGTYMRPFMSSRSSLSRWRPPGLAGGISGATSAHSSSVRSLG